MSSRRKRPGRQSELEASVPSTGYADFIAEILPKDPGLVDKFRCLCEERLAVGTVSLLDLAFRLNSERGRVGLSREDHRRALEHSPLADWLLGRSWAGEFLAATVRWAQDDPGYYGCVMGLVGKSLARSGKALDEMTGLTRDTQRLLEGWEVLESFLEGSSAEERQLNLIAEATNRLPAAIRQPTFTRVSHAAAGGLWQEKEYARVRLRLEKTLASLGNCADRGKAGFYVRLVEHFETRKEFWYHDKLLHALFAVAFGEVSASLDDSEFRDAVEDRVLQLVRQVGKQRKGVETLRRIGELARRWERADARRLWKAATRKWLEPRRRRLWWFVVVLILLALAALGVWVWSRSSETGKSSVPGKTTDAIRESFSP